MNIKTEDGITWTCGDYNSKDLGNIFRTIALNLFSSDGDRYALGMIDNPLEQKVFIQSPGGEKHNIISVYGANINLKEETVRLIINEGLKSLIQQHENR